MGIQKTKLGKTVNIGLHINMESIIFDGRTVSRIHFQVVTIKRNQFTNIPRRGTNCSDNVNLFLFLIADVNISNVEFSVKMTQNLSNAAN